MKDTPDNDISLRLQALYIHGNGSEYTVQEYFSNAESIFYARNDKQELIGIDKSKSGSITILFDDGGIDEYTRYNQIDGNLYPESKFPEKERIYIL